jgi:hypothetical protein
MLARLPLQTIASSLPPKAPLVSGVTELHKALEEIRSIRCQLARGTEFRGYGPLTVALTGLLALTAATVQDLYLRNPAQHTAEYFWIWIPTAALSFLIIGIETVMRSRRVHSGLAVEMIRSALEQFLPAIVAGLLVTVVIARSAPQNLWMLPGLWQVIFSLGVFASCRFLPRPLFGVGVWYLSAGLTCLALGVEPARAFSPWAMGIPFGVGQLLVGAVLQFGYGKTDEYG